MGGTFMSMPEDYRGKFIAQLHNALSGFTGTDVDEAVRYVELSQPVDSQLTHCRYSEQSKSKAIGITIETRPDYCLRPHLRYDFNLLFQANPHLSIFKSNAPIWLHSSRNWCAVGLRRRGPRYEPRSHSTRSFRILPPRQRCWLQSRRAYDA